MTKGRRWLAAGALLIACLVLGWVETLVVATAIGGLSLVIAGLVYARERRPGERWSNWLPRIYREALARRRSPTNTYAVMVSCGHRGWIQSADPPQPGEAVSCCHRRFGPAEAAEVAAVDVDMDGFNPQIIRPWHREVA